MEQNIVKEIPYGISNFRTIAEQNIYYVDKTMYIPMLEKEARNLFFIRPRRFGKSLFLSMLHAYYDILSKDKFQQWFGTMFTYMAFEGKWREVLQQMADDYVKVSSVRDGIEAERNLQGFFMAYLNLNAYYITAPELELSHGYCDFFLLPDLTHYATKHSYILELKLTPKREMGEKAEAYGRRVGQQWLDAEAQIRRYAEAPRVEALRQGTQLHKIIMQFDGCKLRRMDEVE